MILKAVFLPQKHPRILGDRWSRQISHRKKYDHLTFLARISNLLCSISLKGKKKWGLPICCPNHIPHCTFSAALLPGFFLDWGKAQENEFIWEHLIFNHLLLGKWEKDGDEDTEHHLKRGAWRRSCFGQRNDSNGGSSATKAGQQTAGTHHNTTQVSGYSLRNPLGCWDGFPIPAFLCLPSKS